MRLEREWTGYWYPFSREVSGNYFSFVSSMKFAVRSDATSRDSSTGRAPIRFIVGEISRIVVKKLLVLVVDRMDATFFVPHSEVNGLVDYNVFGKNLIESLPTDESDLSEFYRLLKAISVWSWRPGIFSRSITCSGTVASNSANDAKTDCVDLLPWCLRFPIVGFLKPTSHVSYWSELLFLSRLLFLLVLAISAKNFLKI